MQALHLHVGTVVCPAMDKSLPHAGAAFMAVDFDKTDAEGGWHLRRRSREDRSTTSHRLLLGRASYALLIMAIYLLGRTIQIPWVEPKVTDAQDGIQGLVASILGSSRDKTSLFSLGLMPWIAAMVVVQVFQHLTKDRNEKHSQARANWMMLILATGIAALQAWMNAGEMEYRAVNGVSRDMLQMMTAAMLLAGSFVIKWLSDRNTQWGIGGQGLLIVINTMGSLARMLMSYLTTAFIAESIRGLITKLLIGALTCLVIVTMMLFMEGTEFRTTVRRVLINNQYADKDYIAIRMNPVGTMPVMYVMSIFTVPYYVLKLLDRLQPGTEWVQQGLRDLNLNTVPGVVIFGVILWLLTMVLTAIFVQPREIAENLQRQGDFLDGIEPGEPTVRRLTRQTRIASVLSAAVSSALVLPMLYIHAKWGSYSAFYTMPMTVMILVGMEMSILEELKVYSTMEQYRMFL